MPTNPTDGSPDPNAPDSAPPHRAMRPTPRSAPAVAFLEVNEDTAEVTEIPPPTAGNRLPLIIGAMVLVIAAGMLWVSRMSATNGSDALVGQDSLVTGNLFGAAAGIGGSGSFVAQPEIVSAPPGGAVSRYASAIAHGNIDSLVAVAPGLTPEQRSHWEKDVFDQAAFIEAAVEIGNTSIAGDSASIDFVIALKVLDRTTKKETATQVSQHATLVKQGAVWLIASIR